MKKILCPLDFKEPLYDGVKEAVDMAMALDAEVLLMHVLPKPLKSENRLEYESPYIDRIEAAMYIDSYDRLCRVIENFVPYSVRSRAVLACGNAAGEILRGAESLGADMIVIATHGRKGWRRFVYGSVTEKVIRRTPCPVLAVRSSHR
jgi:nucleotide-binding universal stress UspA family protein